MLFNKNKFSKVNDKKVLHKIGKKWVTISVGILAAIGLAGATTAASANTNTMIDHPAMVGHLTPAQRAANRAKRRANGGNNPLNDKIKNNNNARKNGTTPADIAHKHPALTPNQKNKIGQENAAKAKSAADQKARQAAQNKSTADSMARANTQASIAASKAAQSAINALNNNQQPSGYQPLPSLNSSENSDASSAASSSASASASASASTSASVSASNSAAASSAAKQSAEESAGASADDNVNNGIQNDIKSNESKGQNPSNAAKNVSSSTVNSLTSSASSAESSAINSVGSSSANSNSSSANSNSSSANSNSSSANSNSSSANSNSSSANSNSSSANSNSSSANSNSSSANSNSSSANSSASSSNNTPVNPAPVTPNQPVNPFPNIPFVPNIPNNPVTPSNNGAQILENKEIASLEANGVNPEVAKECAQIAGTPFINPDQAAKNTNNFTKFTGDALTDELEGLDPAKDPAFKNGKKNLNHHDEGIATVKNINNIKRGKTAMYRGHKVTRVGGKKVIKALSSKVNRKWIYNSVKGNRKAHVGYLTKNAKVTVKGIFHIAGHKYDRAEIRVGGHDYFLYVTHAISLLK